MNYFAFIYELLILSVDIFLFKRHLVFEYSARVDVLSCPGRETPSRQDCVFSLRGKVLSKGMESSPELDKLTSLIRTE